MSLAPAIQLESPNAPAVPVAPTAHYDAAREFAYLDGDPMPAWKDLTGRGYQAVQGAVAKQPVFRRRGIGNRPAVDFDGVDDQFELDVPALSVFVVGRTDGNGGTLQHWVGGTNNWTAAMAFQDGGAAFHNWFLPVDNGNTEAWVPGTVPPDYGPHLFNYQIDVNAKTAQVYHDGRLDLDHTAKKNLRSGGITRLGCTRQTWYYWTFDVRFVSGLVCEVLIYDRTLTTAERVSVEDYLSRKYRIPLNR
jgi:trimeric autotransporter adhesin